jgi:hypothetical protein
MLVGGKGRLGGVRLQAAGHLEKRSKILLRIEQWCLYTVRNITLFYPPASHSFVIQIPTPIDHVRFTELPALIHTVLSSGAHLDPTAHNQQFAHQVLGS